MSKLIPTPTLAQNTPLHAAARSGTSEGVNALIQAGADVNARDEDGWTPLHAAARSGTSETVIALIGAGADVTARAEDGATAFDLVKKYNREQLQDTDAWRCLKEAQ